MIKTNQSDPVATKKSVWHRGNLREEMRVYVAVALKRRKLFHLMFGQRISDKRRHSKLREASNGSFQFLKSTHLRPFANINPPSFIRLLITPECDGYT